MTRVLLISGTGRSGSTLVANLLGQVEGYFSAGEVRFIWERGLKENRLCGCGRRFLECPVWRGVVGEVAGDVDGPIAAALAGVRVGGRARHVPRMLLRSRDWAWVKTTPGATYLERLYGAIQKETGCDVVVDSSKLPAYGYMLDACPSVDLRVVHLVRDPRAAAFSWSRRKVRRDGADVGYMEQFGPLKSSLLWDTWNLTAEALWKRDPSRYRLVRYEDFVERPREAVGDILEMMGHADRTTPFISDRQIVLGPTHTVSGNPIRLEHGPVEIRLDSEWTREMRGRDRALVTGLTAPLLGRYGYRAARGPGVRSRRPALARGGNLSPRVATWNIGVIEAPIHALLDPGRRPPVRWLPRLPKHRFLADPFPVRTEEGLVVLAEEYDYRKRRGRIVAVRGGPDGSWSAPEPALDLPVHASYPFVVQLDGTIFCVPETAQAREVGLYEVCLDGAVGFRRVATLIDGFPAVDPTVFRFGSHWWLACTDGDGGGWKDLHIWYAPELFGPWRPHARNPVKTDVRSSRPAGTPFEHAGDLYRPAQDNSRTYGGAVVINRVVRLTPTTFDEEVAAVVEPDRGGPYPAGLHTISAAGEATVIDGKGSVFVWGALRDRVVRATGTLVRGLDR